MNNMLVIRPTNDYIMSRADYGVNSISTIKLDNDN